MTNQSPPSPEQLRLLLTPLFHKGLQSFRIFAIFINIILIALALSNIVFYAKVATVLILVMANLILYFRLKSSKQTFAMALNLPPHPCIVTFKIDSIGDTNVIAAEVKSSSFTTTKFCGVNNIHKSIMKMEVGAFAFIENDLLKMVVTEDLKYFAVIA